MTPTYKKARLDEPQSTKQPQQQIISTNEATCFYFHSATGVKPDSSSTPHHPLFTYPFYGEDEQLSLPVGLKRAKIEFWIDPVSMRAWCPEPVIEGLIAPVKEKWSDLMLGGTWDDFVQECQNAEMKWWEEAEKIEDLGKHVIFKCSFKSESFKQFHRRLQIMLLYYIEGASFIEEDDEKWSIWVVTEKVGEHQYAICGYATLYPFLYWPEGQRLRLAQFLILPHRQSQGIGSLLYQSIYKHAIQLDPQVHEFTVEDPNDEFSGLRLTMDCRTVKPLVNNHESALQAWCERGEQREHWQSIRRQLKLAPHAFEDTLLALYLLLPSDHLDFPAYERGVKAIYKARLSDRLPKEGPARQDQLNDLYQDWLERAQRALK